MGNSRGNNDRYITGSVLKTMHRMTKFQSRLKNRHCPHFIDTETVCDFERKCNFDYTPIFPNYHESDVNPMLEFVKKTRELEYNNNVQFSQYVNSNMNRNTLHSDSSLIPQSTTTII